LSLLTLVVGTHRRAAAAGCVPVFFSCYLLMRLLRFLLFFLATRAGLKRQPPVLDACIAVFSPYRHGPGGLRVPAPHAV